MTLAWSSASTANRTTVPETQLYPDTIGTDPDADLLLYHQMDEAAWDGTTGEVGDSSGAGRDGTARNGAQTANTSSAIGGDPGTCGYGTFDGSDDYVSVGNLSNILNGTATLAFWVRTTQTGTDTGWQAPGIAGVEEQGGSDDIFWGWIDASGRIGISAGNDYETEQKSSTAINDGTWHHVALTRDAATGSTTGFSTKARSQASRQAHTRAIKRGRRYVLPITPYMRMEV
jgi:MSHA biogenesis protein MshQ